MPSCTGANAGSKASSKHLGLLLCVMSKIQGERRFVKCVVRGVLATTYSHSLFKAWLHRSQPPSGIAISSIMSNPFAIALHTGRKSLMVPILNSPMVSVIQPFAKVQKRFSAARSAFDLKLMESDHVLHGFQDAIAGRNVEITAMRYPFE